MMRLKVIATGSRGNCYLLKAGDSSLLLDAGVRYDDLIRGTNALQGVCGVLVTHEHQDHIRCAEKLARLGIPVYMSSGTAQAAGMAAYRCAEEKHQIAVGPFTVLPFRTEHDAAEPLGFLIRADGVTLLYATDTYYVRYRFPGVNWWLIECNYVDELVEHMDNIKLRERLMKSHMGLRRLDELFRANDLRATRGVILCHLSDKRSDEAYMIRQIGETTGVPVWAAAAGMEADLCR